MGIKIGCAAWTWTEPAHNPPYEEAIKSIGELGFDGIELILRDFEDVENYWTKDKRKEIKSMVDYYGLQISQFAMSRMLWMVWPVWKKKRRTVQLRLLKTECEISADLGCDIVTLFPHGRVRLRLPIHICRNIIISMFRGWIQESVRFRYSRLN